MENEGVCKRNRETTNWKLFYKTNTFEELLFFFFFLHCSYGQRTGNQHPLNIHNMSDNMLGLDRAAWHSPHKSGSLEFLFWFYKHKMSFRVVKWLWKLWIYSTHIDYMLMMGQNLHTWNTKCNQTRRISMMKKWMATLVCGVREALESINRMVHNQFKHPKVGNSSTQAIFLDPNGLSLRPFQSPLKVFVYLPPKETFFLYCFNYHLPCTTL